LSKRRGKRRQLEVAWKRFYTAWAIDVTTLSVAIHPDRSQTDADRDHRTEAMKEVTRAYQDGDLARLLELEKAWLAAEETPVDGQGETERRCSSLERTNRELKKQLRELENELRELKHSVPVLAADELGLLGTRSRSSPTPGARPYAHWRAKRPLRGWRPSVVRRASPRRQRQR
jgi:hypothetical protein